MQYLPIHLLCSVQTGTDVLGNPVTELQAEAAPYQGRLTPWAAEDVELEGRAVTQNQRRLITNAPLSACRSASGVRVCGENYRILSVEELRRWRLLRVERWR
ncbi:hypothetical protein [uncultured Ruminococcus sp.]|uniref:hypothetical protein n=1 Tax=uncultured Ruminococcus sp. TaxID=165186 RepID=UPI00265DFE57|nr:hypothetical protein [uncultured Ruminococcus sp.]